MRGIQFLVALVGIFSVLNCSKLSPSHDAYVPDFPLPKLTADASYFGSCDDYKAWKDQKIGEFNQRNNQYYATFPQGPGTYATSGVASTGTAAAPAAAASTITNIQEAGVDEPDVFKGDSNYLYYARTHEVVVINQGTLKVVQSIPQPDLTGIQLYVTSGRLIVIGRPYLSYGSLIVREFVQSSGTFSQVAERTLAGYSYADSRLDLATGQLTVVMEDAIQLDTDPNADGTVDNVPCNQIQRPLLDDYEFTVTAVHKINTDGLSMKSLAIVGRVDQIYMTPNNLYIAGNGYTWFPWDTRPLRDLLNQSLIIRKIDVSGSNLSYSSAGAAIGHVRDQYAFKESGDDLFVATSYLSWAYLVSGGYSYNPYGGTYEVGETAQGNGNRVFHLRQSPNSHRLNLVGESPEVGYNEDIRAVRYIDHYAYVVTFERTDPLFAFDLSSGDDPRLLTKLELPGFSAYLHPLVNNLLLGVGYATVEQSYSGSPSFSVTTGVQLSLFDLAHPDNVSLLDSQVFGGRGSHAGVSGDPHAFYYGDGVVGLPVTILKPTSDPNQWGGQLDYSGAMMLSFDSQIHVLSVLTHSEWIPSQCRPALSQGSWWVSNPLSLDIQRITKVGSLIVSVSPFGVKASDPAQNYATVIATQFANGDQQCTNYGMPL